MVASYIESKTNKVGDKESWKIRDNLEWSLRQNILKLKAENLGNLLLIFFATRINSKCRWYYSYSPEPEAAGTDVFLCNWNMENFHAFPPFCLIPQILQKMENEYAEEL